MNKYQYVHHWTKELALKGERPILIILEKIKNEDWKEAEKKWISFFDESKHLINKTVGGGGEKNPKEHTYIYALKDPLDNKIKYVGKANNPAQRYKEHSPNKSKSNVIKFSTVLSQDLLKRLDAYCKAEGRHKSFVIEKALEEFLKRKES